MVKLTLVRHGETEENVSGILQGRMPGTLTEKGWRQIAALRDTLAAQPTPFDLMLTSPLLRALKEMPGSVETVGAMFLRAHAFLKQVLAECDGKCVLAVTHGLFARCLQAAFYGVTIREIPPMENTETRLLEISPGTLGLGPYGASADVVSDK